MRNPYSKHYDETDELCIVKTKFELQKIMNFMMVFNINAESFEYGVSKDIYRILVPKGNLSKVELKEARDAISGILWTLRLPEFFTINK
jgi:hypothetical protein